MVALAEDVLGKTVEVDEAVVGDDGALTLYTKTPDGDRTAVKLGMHAQGLVLQALLGSTLDPTGPMARRFSVAGIARFQSDDDVGISLPLSRQVALHVVLDRSLAAVLGELLETFDDPATWDSSRVN